jgi:hypothetical protein
MAVEVANRLRRPSWSSPPERTDAPTSNDGPYATRPARPGLQLAVRVGIWAAIAVGAVGGIVGLLRPAASTPAATASGEPADDPAAVPAPVAGVAEQAVEAWMLNDEAALEQLFVDRPTALTTPEGFELVGTRTVAGERLSDGYWAVTVLVDLVDGPPAATDEGGLPLEDGEGEVALPDSDTGGASGSGQEGEGTEPTPASWYVEVGVVGDVKRGLSVLAAPAVLPGHEGAGDGWTRSGPEVEAPDSSDPLAQTIEAFLNALLAGEGEPEPYLAPGAVVSVADPPPFVRIELTGLASEQIEDGQTRAFVQVDAQTAGGTTAPLAYEVIVTPRDERWQVVVLWGAPTLGERPGDSEDGSDGGAETETETDSQTDDGAGADPTTTA